MCYADGTPSTERHSCYNCNLYILSETRRHFRRKHNIRLSHRSQKALQTDWKLISYNLVLIISNLDLDLLMTIVFWETFSEIQTCRSKILVNILIFVYFTFRLNLTWWPWYSNFNKEMSCCIGVLNIKFPVRVVKTLWIQLQPKRSPELNLGVLGWFQLYDVQQ